MKIKLINKTIYKSYLNIFLLVTFILSALFSFIVLSEQLDYLGVGYFNLGHAVIFVILTLPNRMVEFSPMSAIISTILTLENLIRHRELIAIKSSGGTNRYIINIFLKISFISLIIIFFAIEFITPILDQYANKIKVAAISKNENLVLSDEGFWAKDKNKFVNIKKIKPGNILQDIRIFKIDGDTKALSNIIYAERGTIESKNRLILNNITVKSFTEKGIEINTYSEKIIKFDIALFEKELISIPIEAASLSELMVQVKELKKRGENYDYILSVFWQKLSIPFAVTAMILFCLPFFINRLPARGELGIEIALAILGGSLIYFLKYILGYIVLIFNIDPFFLIMGPILAILIIDFFLLINVVE
ncbi:MAG: LptF/LptG family permease [Deferribacterota bacterium]|nr:LptF/LptG family permease [Deferribacterota bacterium]